MTYNSQPYKKRQRNLETPTEQVVIEGIFKGIWQLIVWIFGLFQGGKKTKRPSNHAEIQALREHWEQVELNILQESTQALAIAEADKILDHAFYLMGVPGQTMGDRLKASRDRFQPDFYQEIWQAHILRNTLAHQVGATVSSEQARQAVGTFRKALYELGVLA